MDKQRDDHSPTPYRPQAPDRSPARGALGFIMRTREVKLGMGLFAFGMAMALTAFAAWVTHVIWVIGKLAGDVGVTLGQVALAILGTFVPPIGVLHGIMIWLGMGF